MKSCQFIIFTFVIAFVHGATSDDSIVSVTGTAFISMKSEKTNIKFTIVTQRMNANEALTSNNKILETFKGKLDSDQITNSTYKMFDENFQIYQQYKYQNGYDKKFEGFKVSREIMVQVNDPKVAGSIIDKAFLSLSKNDEFNSIDLNSVAPYVSESVKEANKILLLGECAKNAKSKAISISESLGYTIGVLLKATVNEDGTRRPNPSPMLMFKSTSNDMAAGTEMESQGVDLSISCDIDFKINHSIA